MFDEVPCEFYVLSTNLIILILKFVLNYSFKIGKKGTIVVLRTPGPRSLCILLRVWVTLILDPKWSKGFSDVYLNFYFSVNHFSSDVYMFIRFVVENCI